MCVDVYFHYANFLNAISGCAQIIVFTRIELLIHFKFVFAWEYGARHLI